MSSSLFRTSGLKISGKIAFDVPLSAHTTFKVGGPADLFVVPDSWDDLFRARKFARERQMPFFILGGGSNLLVSDLGIRGMVAHTAALRRFDVSGSTLTVDAGSLISDVSELAAQNGLSGLEFIYGMPGTVGGAVWMNARCYGSSISDVLACVEHAEEGREMISYEVRAEDFDYKHSPFQKIPGVICRASFRLEPGRVEDIRERMFANKKDREQKGHYRNPCAGSVFKNDRRFGKPTGQLIDELGLKGFSIGGARIADYHGNIIINTGAATASDILSVIEHIETQVHRHYGFSLEREVLLAGEWQGKEKEAAPV